MPAEKCDWCGRFGGKKYVIDQGPDGRGGRKTYTYYECFICTRRIETENANQFYAAKGIDRTRPR